MDNFEDIYDLYVKNVFKFLLKLTKDYYLSEELTQETFVRAFTNLDNFQGRSSLSVWLCQISKNLYFDFIKSKKNIDYLKTLSVYNASDLEENIVQKDTLNNIIELVMKLPEMYKNVFYDKIYLELNYKELSIKYGRSESWARVTFYRAKCMLYKRIKEENL